MKKTVSNKTIGYKEAVRRLACIRLDLNTFEYPSILMEDLIEARKAASKTGNFKDVVRPCGVTGHEPKE